MSSERHVGLCIALNVLASTSACLYALLTGRWFSHVFKLGIWYQLQLSNMVFLRNFTEMLPGTIPPNIATSGLPAKRSVDKVLPQVEPNVFFVIDTHAQTLSFRKAARNTWLNWAALLGHQYRFFLFNYVSYFGNTSNSTAEELRAESTEYGDIVFFDPADAYWTDLKTLTEDQYTRSGALIRLSLQWVMNYNMLDFIVKVDVDGFICVHHLLHVLKSLPKIQLYYGYFWLNRVFSCRADQCFQVYSRDVVETSLKTFNTSGWDPKGNWAANWGKLARFLWSRGNLTVIDDRVRIEAQQRWHTSHKFQHFRPGLTNEFKGFCRNFVFLHAQEKDYRVFHNLYNLSSVSTGSSTAEYVGANVSHPFCFNRDT